MQSNPVRSFLVANTFIGSLPADAVDTLMKAVLKLCWKSSSGSARGSGRSLACRGHSARGPAEAKRAEESQSDVNRKSESGICGTKLWNIARRFSQTIWP